MRTSSIRHRRRRSVRGISIVLFIIAAPPPLAADELTFDRALALAEDSAPSLQAQEEGIESARSSAVAAGRLPDRGCSRVSRICPCPDRPAGPWTRSR